MDWVKIILLSITSVYALFMIANIFILLFSKEENFDLKTYKPSTPVTILIPARNEEQNIVRCLETISSQDFPKDLAQVIVVDDHSDDQTKLVAEKFLKENFNDYRLLSLDNVTGKKQAILKAMESANGEIIVTRDADTFTEDDLWLKSITHHFDNSNCDMLISPVVLTASPLQGETAQSDLSDARGVARDHQGVSKTNSFLGSFQQFENLAIVSLGMSMAKVKMPFVCSGANLAYKKEKFLETAPYADNLQTASGDDMFLLKNFYLNKGKIAPNASRSAIVYSPAENSLKKMLSQRLRWASKSVKTSTFPVFFVGLLVLIMNTLYLPALCLGFINSFYLSISLFTLTLKFIIDFLLLFLSARMYKQKVNWLWFPLAFLFNGLYVPSLVLASPFVKPRWKSREI